MSAQWVLVTLKDGTRFAGFCGSESFMSSDPAFCIGLFESFVGPVESRTGNFGYPWRTAPSDAGFARYLIERGLDGEPGGGVDWAVSEFWKADHGIMAPLHKIDPDGAAPMVPVFVSCGSQPMPSARCRHAVGRWLAKAITGWDADKRVAIMATGGLSHSAGSATQGYIDAAFDEWLLDRLAAGEDEALAALSDLRMDAAGSSTAEVRAWILLAGAFAGRPAERGFYAPIKGFDTGCGQALYAWMYGPQ